MINLNFQYNYYYQYQSVAEKEEEYDITNVLAVLKVLTINDCISPTILVVVYFCSWHHLNSWQWKKYDK